MVWGCGSCRRTKGLGIFKLPAAKDPEHINDVEGSMAGLAKTPEKNSADGFLSKWKHERQERQTKSMEQVTDAVLPCRKKMKHI